MNSSPKLRPTGYDALVVLVILLLAAGLGLHFFLAPQPEGTLTAVVEVDGEEADRFPLGGAVFEERTYSSNGVTLTVSCEAGEDGTAAGVRVSKSDCPSQDCVHTGVITRAGESILCLPAHIVITITGDQPDYDLITG